MCMGRESSRPLNRSQTSAAGSKVQTDNPPGLQALNDFFGLVLGFGFLLNVVRNRVVGENEV
jgi:hypothetical protein